MNALFQQKNKIIFLLALIAIALSCHHFFSSIEKTPKPAAVKAAGLSIATNESASVTERKTLDEKNATNENPQHLASTQKAASIIPKEKTITAITKAAIMDTILQWQESRGLYTNESLTDYLSYDWDTLNKLSSDGDIKAMMALANLSLTEPYFYQRGIEYYDEIIKKAAIYGSSEALSMTAIRSHTQFSDTGDRKHLIESLAWNNTAVMRGDNHPLGAALQELVDKNITLSGSEVADIRSRSQEIYNDLLQQREALGLGPFDNSASPLIREYQEYLRHRFKDGFKLFEIN